MLYDSLVSSSPIFESESLVQLYTGQFSSVRSSVGLSVNNEFLSPILHLGKCIYMLYDSLV